MTHRAGFLALMLLAAACQQSPATEGPSWTYACADGSTVNAWYPDRESARVRLGDQTIDMKIAISASGARYVGGGFQWWTKGEAARLAPLAPGEEIASTAGVSCTGEPSSSR